MLDAVAAEGWHELGDAIAKGLASADDPKLALHEVGVAYVTFARQNPALYRLMYHAACNRAMMPDKAKGEDSGYARVREALIAAGADPNDERELQLAHIAAWCNVHGVAEMVGFKEFEPLREALGGEEAFVRAILRHTRHIHPQATARLTFVTRFAPSPTGRLHRGHAFSALTAFAGAATAGGRFLLRIEDIDAGRCRPEYEAAIKDDLTWLGLSWEEPVVRQSGRMDTYAAALERLRTRGLVYRCFRTRKETLEDIARAPHGAAERRRPTPGARRPVAGRGSPLLAAGRPFAWRLSLAAAGRALGGFSGLTFEEEGAGPGGDTARSPPARRCRGTSSSPARTWA